MVYRNDFEWQRVFGKFSDDEQKVLLALSHDRYRWRTRRAMAKTTGLSENELDRTLTDLVSRDLVRATFSREKDLVFGLVERVGRGGHRKMK